LKEAMNTKKGMYVHNIQGRIKNLLNMQGRIRKLMEVRYNL